jgi:hypothetical protein
VTELRTVPSRAIESVIISKTPGTGPAEDDGDGGDEGEAEDEDVVLNGEVAAQAAEEVRTLSRCISENICTSSLCFLCSVRPKTYSSATSGVMARCSLVSWI